MERWKLMMVCFFLCSCLVHGNFELCASLNDEGRALLRFKKGIEIDPNGALWNWVEESLCPCLWFGVECSDDGRVVALNLKDLGLKGILAPVLGRLIHMRTLNLNNNSLYGIIPRDIGDLKKLEVLDLGNNKFSGPFPSELGSIFSLEVLSLGGNIFSDDIPPELYELIRLSEIKANENLVLPTRGSVTRKVGNATIRRLLKIPNRTPDHRHAKETPPLTPPAPSPSLVTVESPPPQLPSTDQEKKHVTSWIIYGSVGGVLFSLVALSAVYLLCIRANKIGKVLPWATGLSGQLQKALVTGVPSLARVELQSACEDFSNVIGSLSDVTLYKGTLSGGVEIAVASTLSTSGAQWSDQSEDQFRKKISVLSKVNHKNFMNLLGYCEDEEPFTRMMVFEYAPNGTLFEHLHIKEAEQLDWAARLRIVMGTIYCLEHMHQLGPPVILRNLNSSSIYLTEDYAAKISDIGFWNEEKEAGAGADPESSDQESIVYKFGILLLEIISGRLPFEEDDGLLVLWASSYLTGKRPLNDMVDPTLSVPEDDISALCEVIRSCINPQMTERPTVAEVASRMRLITSIAPDGATPRLSPLWWAELEIMSAEAT
ncbi:protein MALE DISCOVERER 2-like isoform X1 [Typha latifolia]|uniref:protein MALE DISCOVERER 2-like isoform X1 n=1 Tax=Typha latifolia TaxID=4733 RepID=UPI003C2C8590